MIAVVEETIRLAKLRLSERLEPVAGEDPPEFELKPAARELLEYLKSLSTQEAHRLLTLMYFGRGDDGNLFRIEEQLHHDNESAIFSMFEKSPLAEYLSNGLERAERLGIDIDAWWRGELVRPPEVQVPRVAYEGPTFACSEPERDPVKHGGEIFLELAAEWPWETIPISDTDTFSLVQGNALAAI